MAVLGPGSYVAVGEMQFEQQLFNNQIAATVAKLLGERFVSSRNVGKPLQVLVTLPEKMVKAEP